MHSLDTVPSGTDCSHVADCGPDFGAPQSGPNRVKTIALSSSFYAQVCKPNTNEDGLAVIIIKYQNIYEDMEHNIPTG